MREKTSLLTLVVVSLSLGVSGCGSTKSIEPFVSAHLADKLVTTLGPDKAAFAVGAASLGLAALEAAQNQKQQNTSTKSTTTSTSSPNKKRR